nr:ImmA/IrrE family metallo-endopeptidase [Sulfobacillus harzensis]
MIRYVGDGHVIYVRATDPPARQRFTIAHELGHYLLQIRGVRDNTELNAIERGNVEALYRRAGQVDDEERAANAFAASLLMPAPILRKLGDTYKPRVLAGFLAVSEEALRIRLRSFA